jgi:Ubiquitin-2 like Rad60 SUMO-like
VILELFQINRSPILDASTMSGEDTAETKPKLEGGDDGILSIKVKDQQGGEVRKDSPPCVLHTCACSSQLQANGAHSTLPHALQVVFKVKKTTKFNKILSAFCQKKAVDQAQVRFIFDGQRVRPEATPEELGMENDDVSTSQGLGLQVSACRVCCMTTSQRHRRGVIMTLCLFWCCRLLTPSWSRLVVVNRKCVLLTIFLHPISKTDKPV